MADEVQLIDVGTSRPQRPTGKEFGEDARDGPDVNRRTVQYVADQQLGCPVPPRRHVVGKLVAGFCSERIIATDDIA